MLFLVMFVLTMPTIVKAERNTNYQEDTAQQEKYKYKQDKQLRAKQQREQQEREKQLRAKHQREQQERDKQIQVKQQRDRRERDKQIQARQQDQQRREHLEKNKHQPNKWQPNHRQHDGRHKWSHPVYNHKKWHRSDYRYYGTMPYKWNQRFNHHSPHYQIERIHVREWNDRFPGLHLYKWMDRRGEGFWYRNHRIVDAILFYNDSDELVSIGFVHDGIFVMIRDDDECYENDESFFLSWWNRNVKISIRL